MAQLICRNVAVGYGSKVVLHNIDFEVHVISASQEKTAPARLH